MSPVARRWGIALMICVVHTACSAAEQAPPERALTGQLNDRPWVGVGKTHVFSDGVVLVGGYRGGDDYCKTSPDCESITVRLRPGHPALQGGSGEVRGEIERAFEGRLVSTVEVMGTLTATTPLRVGARWEGELELRSVPPNAPLIFREGRFIVRPQRMNRPWDNAVASGDSARPRPRQSANAERGPSRGVGT